MTGRATADCFNPKQSALGVAYETIRRKIDSLISSLPNPDQLSPDGRRGIIARYTAILEANFICWMAATFLSVSTEQARNIVKENLREEIGDNHPEMLRRFAIAARAVPTDSDHLAVHPKLQEVRNFVAALRGVQLLLMMAFFEGFIAKFMPYLACLAVKQGSSECKYTDVHSLVDVNHAHELFRAADAELAVSHQTDSLASMFEGVEVLERLLELVINTQKDNER